MLWIVFLLLAKAIDEYASLKSRAGESNDEALVDPRLEAIVERMLDKYVDLYYSLLYYYSPICLIFASFRCIVDGRYQQAMGMAVECRRLDKLEEAITRSDNVHGTLSYCINISHSFVNRREYRREVRG